MTEWFSFSNLKRNASKCHLLISPYQRVPVMFEILSVEAAILRNY